MTKKCKFYSFIKRLLDLGISIAAFLILLPLFIIVAIILRFTGRNAGKTYKNSEVENFKANQWIDMLIEYQQGKMLLNINGNETIFEHEGVNMDGAKSIVFKYRNIDRTLFDYVRLWEVTE